MSPSYKSFLSTAAEFRPEDWFMLVPYGEFANTRKLPDGKTQSITQVIDNAAVAAILANFLARQEHDPSYKMLLDFDHFSHEEGKPSAAACWITELDPRPEGIFASGEWTPEGIEAVRGGKYRFISPVWYPAQTEDLGDGRIRPLAVNDAALTNKPNFGEAMLPIKNAAPAPGAIPTRTTIPMKELIALLGLDAAATEEQVLAAVKSLAQDKTQTAERITALEAALAKASGEKTAALDAAAEGELVANADVIPEADKAAWKNRLTEDFSGTSKLLRGLKRVAPAAPGRIAPAAQTAASGAKLYGQMADAAAQNIPFLNHVREIEKADNISRDEATLKAAERFPEEYRKFTYGA